MWKYCFLHSVNFWQNISYFVGFRRSNRTSDSATAQYNINDRLQSLILHSCEHSVPVAKWAEVKNGKATDQRKQRKPPVARRQFFTASFCKYIHLLPIMLHTYSLRITTSNNRLNISRNYSLRFRCLNWFWG